MAGLRTSQPTAFGSFSVQEFRDLANATDQLPATDGVIFMLRGSGEIKKARVIVRPSGTEPKIKCYLEVVSTTQDLEIAEQQARAALDELARAAEPLLQGK